MPETIYLTHILFILLASVLVVPVFQRLGLGSVLGYITAGAIIGPWGLGLINQVEEISHIAEFGVIFLLFIIGIELNFTRLWAMKRMVFGLGMAQLVVTGIVLASLAFLLGLNKETAIIVGFGFALSSTAFSLQVLTERNELNSMAGRTSFSILLLQDLAVVPLLALVSFLAHDASLVENINFSFLDIFLVIVAVILVGRFILTPALRLVAVSHNAELFISAALLVVLGTAWLMDAVGLSMALGAFLAGLMLADSHYRHQIIADVQPFRGILLGLFFMSVGMAVDFGLFLDEFATIIGLVIALVFIKITLLWIVCRLARINNGTSIRISMLLSQSGEFGLVLFGLATAMGLMTASLFQMLTLIIAMSMITTPLMAIAGEHIEKYLRKSKTQDFKDIEKIEVDGLIILAGFGRVGKRIAKILEAAQISYLALDNDPDLVTKEQENGFSVIYGDASRYDVLNSLGVSHANAIVITIDKVNKTESLVHIIHDHCPKVPIYARGRDKEHCVQLYNAGVSISVSETLEASLKLGEAALSVSGVADNEVKELMKDFRKTYYGELKD